MELTFKLNNMKNIHLLPTEKPSRLHYSKVQSEEGISYKLILNQEESKCNNGLLSGQRHIYITDDSEIKEGDWICDIELNRVEKSQYSGTFKNWKKIILTTDQDLIADGVQAIEDEFLEWFVKNPSCEEVEVNYIKTPSQIFIANDVPYGYYKIIIPQEEPNPFELPKALPDDVFFKSLEEPKQETLEEAFSKELKSKGLEFSSNLNPLDMFNLGVKWQSERMYSEEEVLDLLLTWRYTNHDLLSTKEWLEQFKKK